MARKKNQKLRRTHKRRVRRRGSAKSEHVHPRARRKSMGPRTLKQFLALPHRTQDRWSRATQAVSKMRTDGISTSKAAKDFHLTRKVLIRLAKSALRKQRNGRYVAKPTDKLLRVLALPSVDGLREVAVRGSSQASRLGQYWAAVQKYLQTGDASALSKFRGEHITDASRKHIPLITDPEELNRLGSAGVLSFESLYAGVA